MRSRTLTIALVSLGVFAAVLGLRAARLLQGLELLLKDQYVRYAVAQSPASSRIAVIEITEEDIREQGHYPFSDGVLAKGLRALVRADARVVGLDIYRDLPVPPGAARLEALLRGEPRIFAVSTAPGADLVGIPGPPALRGSGRVGFNDQLLDPDGVVRRGLLFLDDGEGEVGYAFALQLTLAALAPRGIRPAPDPDNPEWLRLGATTIRPLTGDHGGYAGEDEAGYQFLLDFGPTAAGFETISFGELLQRDFDAERVRDRIALVGVNAQSLPDVFLMPLRGAAASEKMPGVVLHAHLVDQLMRYALGESAPIRVLSDAQETALLLLFSLLGGVLGLGVRGTPTRVGIAIVGSALVWLAGAAAYRAGWWVPMVGPGVAWMASLGIVTAWTSTRERAERAQVMQIFSRLVSPEVAEEMWRHRSEFFKDGRPRSRRVTATVLFLDMKGYTQSAEKMEPEQLMAWVNDFMEPMADMVRRCGGVVDDYFGDGLKANFGVPFAAETEDEIAVDARRAVSCAIKMASALDRLNACYRERRLPTVAVRIGIHTGPVVVGSLGSAEHLKYTTVGDVVVTSQRLESLDVVAHDYERNPFRILVTAQTLRHLDGSYVSEPLGLFVLNGMNEEVEVHRIAGRRA
jgi:adenylate cyclase